jgi:hypothetical protein
LIAADEFALLLGRGHHGAPRLVGIPKRREDPAANPKVRVTVMGVFDGILEAEGDTPKR